MQTYYTFFLFLLLSAVYLFYAKTPLNKSTEADKAVAYSILNGNTINILLCLFHRIIVDTNRSQMPPCMYYLFMISVCSNMASHYVNLLHIFQYNLLENL